MPLEIIHRLPTANARSTPLLFVHGVSHGAWCWEDHFLDYFAGHGYPSYALSLRGHGASSGGLKGTRIRDYIVDVAEAVSTLPEPPVLVGHSMGALIVQKYLEQQPPVRGGVLMAGLPPSGRIATGLRLFRHFPGPVLKLFLLGDWAALNAVPDYVRVAYFAEQTPQDIVEACSRRLQNESMIAFYDMQIFQRLHPERVKAPVLVIGTERDQVIAPNQSAAVAAAYQVPLILLPDLGHDMMLEPGWQRPADEIRRWLQDCGF